MRGLTIKEKVIDFPMDEYGEDRLFKSPSFVGVIDGATPIRANSNDKYYTQAEWIADILSNYLSSGKYQTIKEGCLEFIKSTMNSEFVQGKKKADLPSAVLAGVEVEGKNLLVKIIGDCLVSIKLTNGNIITLSDHRIKAFTSKNKAFVKASMEEGMTRKEASAIQRTKNKKFMNVKDGFWTIAHTGDISSEFDEYSFPLHVVDSVLIYTDGFERLFNKYNILDIKPILDEKISLNKAISLLREYESQHTEKYSKNQDDASAILLKVIPI